MFWQKNKRKPVYCQHCREMVVPDIAVVITKERYTENQCPKCFSRQEKEFKERAREDMKRKRAKRETQERLTRAQSVRNSFFQYLGIKIDD